MTNEHNKKEITIIVNGRQKQVQKDEMTFAEIVALAGDLPSGPDVIYTVTYQKGEGDKSGSLVEGASIRVKDGMIFNVKATNRS
jgi:hypothetical protein